MSRFSAVALAALVGSTNANMFKSAIEEGIKSASSMSAPIAGRELENDYYNQWMTKYSMVFDKCHTLPYMGEQGNNNKNNGQSSSPVKNQMVVTYRMCAAESCASNCKGAEYVVAAGEFANSYLTYKMNAQEQTCALAQEKCEYDCEYGKVYNDNGGSYYWQDNANCLNACYKNKGFDYCIDDGDDFNALDYVECKQIKNNGNNNNNNNGNDVAYYVGPKCANSGSEIHLQLYTDATCTTEADNSIYTSMNYYGKSLPYSSSSLISNDCLSCKEQNDNDGNQNYYDANDADQLSEVCERIYEEAGHCESNLEGIVSYPKVDSCTFIQSTLPSLSKALNGNSSSRRNKSGGGGGKAAVFFAWFFAISTCGLAYYVYFLIKKIKNATNLASLDHSGGAVA